MTDFGRKMYEKRTKPVVLLKTNALWKLPEAFWQLPESVWQLPNHIRQLPDGFRQFPKSVRKLPIAVWLSPNDLWLLPNFVRLLPNGVWLSPKRNLRTLAQTTLLFSASLFTFSFDTFRPRFPLLPEKTILQSFIYSIS